MTTHHATSQLSWSTRALNLLICSSGIIICYGAYSVYQEEITRRKYGENKEYFTYMQALVFVQCLINMLVAMIAKRGQHFIDNVPGHLYWICSTSYFLAMLFSNLALEWINYPTQVLGKSCKPIPIMLFGVFFAHKRYAWRKYLYVLLIVVGMAIFLFKEQHASKTDLFEFGRGELLLTVSLTMDGMTGAVQDRIRHNHTTNKWSMMFSMNFFATIFLAASIFLSGEAFGFIRFVSTYPFVLREMILFAAFGAVGQCFIFKTVTDFGPLTCSIITTLRKLFSLIFSIILFNHPYTNRHVISIVVVFVALFLDAVESRRTHQNSKNKSDDNKENNESKKDNNKKSTNDVKKKYQ